MEKRRLTDEEKAERRRAVQKRWNAKESAKAAKRAYYFANKERILLRAQRLNKDRKRRVLTHYGNGELACVACGERVLACLTIDHISDDGAKHRRELGIRTGYAFYFWLMQAGLPKGYQTLCMNCQFKKAYDDGA